MSLSQQNSTMDKVPSEMHLSAQDSHRSSPPLQPQDSVNSRPEFSGSTTHNPYSFDGSVYSVRSLRTVDSPPLTPRDREQQQDNSQEPGSKSQWEPMISMASRCSSQDEERVEPAQNLRHFEKGFFFGLYNHGSTQYYQVPSENVVPTKGALKYVEQYNSYGASLRFRFQLCHKFLAGKCDRGESCPYVHVTSLGKASSVHLNNPENSIGKGDTLPAGAVLYIHPPGTITAPPQMIPSEYLLRTQGAMAVYEAVVNHTPCAIIRPQHCAHFQFKRVCNRGNSCNFIHSLVPLQASRPAPATPSSQEKQ